MRFAAELVALLPPPTATAFVIAHRSFRWLPKQACRCYGTLLARGTAARIGQAGAPPGPIEPLLLLGVLIAGAIAALAWPHAVRHRHR
jgi:hypothetical protein